MSKTDLKICPMCNKAFIPTLFWIYKTEKGSKKIYYCSYHCFREAGGGKGKFKNFPKKRGELYI